jgi:hypothetical protein
MFMDKRFDIEITDNYGKFVFKITASRETEDFEFVPNFRNLIRVLNVDLATVMLDRTRLYWIHDDLWGRVEFVV